ncbi:MAG: peptidoglycan DD-metalloendopeptidase family protein [Hyphomicrobiaceae bacterium]|nr:peptidoglycan DD-metalloendopeptidase family protein [Hyphomicrobiaceae bacterium]
MPNAIRSFWRAPAKIFAIWIGAGAIGWCLDPCTASAQATPPAKTDADKKALDAKREQLKENRKREQEIQKDLAALAAERVKITEESKLLAGKVQESENQLSMAEGKLSELDGQEKALRSSLTERYGKISKLLSVLQRMGRNPPPVMITKREDALKMVRSAMLIAAAFPEMRAQAVSLSAKLNELVKVMDNVREERAKTEAYAKDLKDKRQQLDALMETKRELYAQKQTDLQSVRTAAAEIAKGAEKLSELIAKVDQTVAKNTELGAYNEDAKAQELNPDAAPPPGGAPNALELTPAAKQGKSEPLRPLIAFNLAKAKLPLPAAGRRVLSFGEKTQYGAQSKGIVIETRAFAQVTSPCDGWIVFAGEFRSYGRVLIINPGGGYHVLMAGLSQIDVSTGQFVVAGEPVANMSGGAPSAAQTAQASAPVLYIEFRKDGEPIDPDPWWVASKQVESGKKVQG